jgi:hypothetical protein
MIGRSGIGHGKLSGDDFRTLAVKLDAMSQTGGEEHDPSVGAAAERGEGRGGDGHVVDLGGRGR